MNMEVGKWKINVGPEGSLSTTIVNELERWLSGPWKKAAMQDIAETGFWWKGARDLGIPSPIVRVDMAPTIVPSSKYLYEVEVRPGGLGVALSLLSNTVIPHLSEEFPGECGASNFIPIIAPLTFRPAQVWRECLKGCEGFVHLESPIQDDGLAAQLMELSYFEEDPVGKGLYWIRTSINDPRAPALEEKSVVPIRLDGHKGYLVKLGLARLVKNPSDLPWEEGFVIKPLQGSRMEGIEIWGDAYLRRQNKPGLSTRKRIIGRVEERPYLVQPFIYPRLEEYQGREGWTIWRLFFGWKESKYSFIGGLWHWRPNLRIHGAIDAVLGPLERK